MENNRWIYDRSNLLVGIYNLLNNNIMVSSQFILVYHTLIIIKVLIFQLPKKLINLIVLNTKTVISLLQTSITFLLFMHHHHHHLEMTLFLNNIMKGMRWLNNLP